ncbi:hypothetical protein ACIQUE_29150 [Bacillus cereus]|uniref:hypothetical protein n=1 Tax=Bacillati TaxID=1783272 RepID=UPI00093BFD02|nr:hypothetical protein [Streptomyces sp. CB03234]OKK06435.1 hypothetical protein AMK26_10470 [Streptomyces sp. CB03234]
MTEPQHPTDTCRPVEIDGELIRVRISGDLSDESRAALAEIIRAAKRKFAAEHPPWHTADTITSDALDVLYARAEHADSVTAQAKRLLTRRTETLRERAERAEAALAAANARADKLSATLCDVLSHLVHPGHPGEPCLRTGWISVKTVDRWRAALTWTDPSWQCPNCGGLVPHSQQDVHLRSEAEAALDRVRDAATLRRQGLISQLELYAVIDAALEEPGQPEPEPDSNDGHDWESRRDPWICGHCQMSHPKWVLSQNREPCPGPATPSAALDEPKEPTT